MTGSAQKAPVGSNAKVGSGTNVLAAVLLRLMALQFNLRPSLRRYLRSRDGWIDFSIGFRTESGSVAQTLEFRGGRVKVRGGVHSPTTTLIFHDDSVVKEMLSCPPNEVLLLLMRGRMRSSGNLVHLSLFNFYMSLVMRKRQAKMLWRARIEAAAGGGSASGEVASATGGRPRITDRLTASPADAVRCLEEPNIARYCLDDFPRLERFLEFHFTTKPEICPERPALLTQWHRENGFETDQQGKPWNPVLRQALAFRYLMENRQPIIRSGDLLGGTTTSKDIGVVIYPDAVGTLIWGELLTAPDRLLNPYVITPETVRVLHQDVFPYWVNRNFREWVRARHGEPVCQQLDDRFAVYFAWKTAALSHTIPDYPKLLGIGARGIIAEIDRELAADSAAEPSVLTEAGLAGRSERPAGDRVFSAGTEPAARSHVQGSGEAKRDTLEAMKQALEGLVTYARNVAAQARREAAACADPTRAEELRAIAEACERVPEHPARNLQEAVQAVWLGWVGLHMENTNAGLSIGRLDQWLQPYFEADMAQIADPGDREAYVRRAIELVGCFYLRCTDHLPLVPDIGNYLFGGSSSDQAITLGGIARDGSSGVNDMTYVFLKVTEMLKLRDPNVNARFSTEHNSDAYLRRLCEVNLVTAATPSMHCDEAVMASIAPLWHEPEI
ncbi:MAG: pyruvate formate lyase family protein, partial [Actinomycetota bacterium]